jgi:hypothetical protein
VGNEVGNSTGALVDAALGGIIGDSVMGEVDGSTVTELFRQRPGIGELSSVCQEEGLLW